MGEFAVRLDEVFTGGKISEVRSQGGFGKYTLADGASFRRVGFR